MKPSIHELGLIKWWQPLVGILRFWATPGWEFVHEHPRQAQALLEAI